MAREKVKQVQVFSLPTEYERQTAEARRREMMAEMLAQQAYDPGQYQGAPIPKAAPVVKALEGYLRGREMRKAREAGEAAEKAGRTEFADYIRSFEPERRTVSTADVAAMEMPTPSIDASGRVAYTPASAIAAPNQQVSGSSMTDPLQMQVGGPLSMAQRRARALEGFESTNPMVQQFAATQYEKTMPRELDLKLGAINPAEVDMASVAEAQRTGDISRIKPRAKPAEATKPVTRIGSEDLGDRVRTYFSDGSSKDTPKGLAPTAPKEEKPQTASEGERKDAYNLGRVVTAANQIQSATKTEPQSVRPGFGEAAIGMLPFGIGEDIKYRAQSPQRQIIDSAQTDLIDAALTLATGAAYTKEQLAGQVRSLIPRYGESDESIAAKDARLRELMSNAKVRAGRAWTPELDAQLAKLFPALQQKEEVIKLPPRPR